MSLFSFFQCQQQSHRLPFSHFVSLHFFKEILRRSSAIFKRYKAPSGVQRRDDISLDGKLNSVTSRHLKICFRRLEEKNLKGRYFNSSLSNPKLLRLEFVDPVWRCDISVAVQHIRLLVFMMLVYITNLYLFITWNTVIRTKEKRILTNAQKANRL